MKLTLTAIANPVNHPNQKLVPPVLSIINQVILVQEMIIQLRIQRNNGLATEKKVLTSTVGMKDENKDHGVQKAKIEIVLGKSAKFDFLMTTAVTAAMTPAMTTVNAKWRSPQAVVIPNSIFQCAVWKLKIA
nr:uncharacterized protein CFP56_35157 [Quercus suber]